MTRIWKHLPRHGDDASRNRTSQILHASGHFKFGIARCSESVIHSNHASHHTTGTRSKHNASLHCGTEICLLLLQMRMEQNHEQELSEWLHLDLLLQQSCRSPTLQYYWLSESITSSSSSSTSSSPNWISLRNRIPVACFSRTLRQSLIFL